MTVEFKYYKTLNDISKLCLCTNVYITRFLYTNVYITKFLCCIQQTSSVD